MIEESASEDSASAAVWWSSFIFTISPFYTHSSPTYKFFLWKKDTMYCICALNMISNDLLALEEARKCFYRYWYCEHITTRTMMNQDVTLYFYNSQDVSACISSN